MKLNCIQEKYAELRNQRVDKLAKRFGEDPDLAIILSDRKLGSDPLILLRKENLDKLISQIREVSGVEDVIFLIKSCELFLMIAKETKVEDPIVNKAIEILEYQVKKIKAILSPNLLNQNQNDGCS